MPTKFTCIEDFLGEKSTRFFSNGYKRITRTITNIVMTPLKVEAICRVSVPEDWSVKGSTRQTVHLSSLDALLIALQLSEAYCVVLYALTASMRRAITIVSFSIKAGRTPLENLENFNSTTVLSSVDGSICSFTNYIGGMSIHLCLRLPLPPCPVSFHKDGVRYYSAINTILGEPANNFYGVGFSNVSHDITNVNVDLEASSVTATIDSTFPRRTLYEGMETMFDSCASPIDAMVILSQLAQCYLYLLDGISRANSSTLWMRAMTFSRIGTLAGDSSFSRLDVVRSERLLREEKLWRCVNVKGYIGDMSIFYALGHALPI